MGKSCVRFKKIEDLPLDLIGEAVARVSVKDFLAHYTAAISPSAKKARKKKAAKKKVARKKTAKKKASKKR